MRRNDGPLDASRVNPVLAELDPKRRAKLESILRCRIDAAGKPYWSIEAFNVRGLSLKDVAALLAKPLPVTITRLRLMNMAWKPPGLAELAASPGMAAITHLDLYSCVKLVDGIEHLIASPHLAGLQGLALERCELKPKHVELVLGAPWKLVELDLTWNKLGEAGAKLVGKAKLPALRSLAVGSNEGYDAWVEQLAASNHLGALEQLDLTAITSGDTAFGPHAEGWSAFAACATFPNLRDLGLKGNTSFKDAAAIALAGNAAFSHLAELDLSGTGITEAGFTALANSKHVKPKHLAISKHLDGVPALFPAGVVAQE